MQKRIEQNLNNLRELTPTNVKVILNEVGAGMPVYTKMVSVQGVSSRLVLHAESNNDIEFTKEYNSLIFDKRLVSKYNSYILAYNTKIRVEKYYKRTDIDIYSLSNTVQMANNDNCTSHGYFSILNSTKGFTHYHYTLPTNLSRQEQIDLIGLIGLEILNYHINGIEMTNGFIDYTSEGIKKLVELNMLPNRLSTEMNFNTAFYVNTDNEVCRFNEIFRKLNDDQNLLIYKGSFNPVSPGHLHTMGIATDENNISENNRYFCITLGHRLDKKISSQSMVDRIELLTSLGYQVIVDTMPYFNDIYHHVIKCLDYNGCKVVFPLGEDVLKRLYDDCTINFQKVNDVELTIKEINKMFEVYFLSAIFYAFDREEKAEVYDVKNIKYYSGEYDYNRSISSTILRNLVAEDAFITLKRHYSSFIKEESILLSIIEKLKKITF